MKCVISIFCKRFKYFLLSR